MSTANARTRWEELRERIDSEARASKSSQPVVLELSHRYRALGDVERSEVDELLAEWVLSEDEGKRFDAMAVIAENKVVHAVPDCASSVSGSKCPMRQALPSSGPR